MTKPTQPSLWELLHNAFHKPKTRAYRIVDGTVWALVLFSLLLLLAEVVFDNWSQEIGPGRAAHAVKIVQLVDYVVLGLFALELFLRLISFQPPTLQVFRHRARSTAFVHVFARLRYLLHPMQLVDLVTVVAVVPALRGLRLLRLLRLLKSPRLFPYGNPFKGIVHAFEGDRVLFIVAFTALGVETILGGLTFYLVEKDTPGSAVQSAADGLWWALVTLTTVGYGDYSPVTAVGRFIGGFMMVGGMFTLALFAGIVGHSLLNAVLSVREEGFRMSGYVNHIIVCGFEDSTAPLLKALREEIDVDDRRVVLFADHKRPHDLPPEFLWVEGNPRRESELDKVRLTHASSVVIVGSRELEPSIADASTILIAFTIRSYLSKQPEASERQRPLQIIAEILDEENASHARASGIDEVIETRRVGFSMISHSVMFPGVGDLTGRVVALGENNFYTGILEGDDATHEHFGELAEALRHKYGILVLGWREPSTTTGPGTEHVNPSDSDKVPSGAEVIYLAELPVLPSPGHVETS